MVKLRELKDIKRNPYKEIIPKLTRTKLSSRYVSLSLDREVFNDYIKDLTTTQLGHLMKLIYYLGDEYVVKDMEGKVITTVLEFEEIFNINGVNLKLLVAFFVKKGFMKRGHRDLLGEPIPKGKRFYMFNPVLKTTGMKYDSGMIELYGKELVKYGIIEEEGLAWSY